MTAPKGFCESLPMQPRIYDPTRLAIMDTCWRKHLLATIRGLRRNGQPSVHLTWGKDYHECVEEYDRAVLDNEHAPQASAISLAIAKAGKDDWGETIETWRCTDPEMVEAKRMKIWRRLEDDGSYTYADAPLTNFEQWELVPKMIPNRARCKFAKGWQPVDDDASGFERRKCECGAQIEFGETFIPYNPKKTGETLIAAVKAYCESATSLRPYQFPDGTKALELQARLPLPIESPDEYEPFDPEGNLARPRGHLPYELLVNIDSLVEWEEDIAIRERKTTGLHIESPLVAWKYWAQWDPNIQIETYDLVGSVLYQDEDGRPPKIMVEALCIAKPEEPIIERRVIHLSEARRAETFREIQSLILDAEKRAIDVAAGVDPEVAFPRRPTACVKGFQICPFYDVCTASPSDREVIIAANYHEERWDPEAAESFTLEGESNEV